MLREPRTQFASADGRHPRPYPFSASIVIGSLAICDLIAIGTSGLATYTAIVGWHPGSLDYYLSAITFVGLAYFMLAHFGHIHVLDAVARPVAYLDSIALALGIAFLFLFATLFSLHVSNYYSRLWTGSFACTAFFSIAVLRIAAQRLFAKLYDSHLVRRNVAVVGAGAQAHALIAHMRDRPPHFATLVGVFEPTEPAELLRSIEGLPVLGNLRELTKSVRSNLIDDIVIAMPWSEDEKVGRLVEELREFPVSIYLAADLVGFRLDLGHTPNFRDNTLGLFPNTPVVELSRRPLSGWSIIAKVVEDYVLGIILLTLLTPVFALVAAAIKLDSPGPVFFRQKRLGFNNREFYIYKFRSMRIDDCKAAPKTAQATRGDPRVTRIGRFIRKTSIDELPQLLNVLNGTMSLVGPRPHALDHNEDYSSRIRGYFARHRVKPGITGWAQVNGLRGETQRLHMMESRVQHDVHYIENWSVLFDLRILLQTVFVILIGRNAY